LSNGVNKSIAVVRGCSVDFVLDANALTNHPFHIQFTANNTDIPVFTQGQTSGTVTWDVPDAASATTYKYQCGIHSAMHNYIRVLDNCDMAVLVNCTDYCMNISTVCTGANIQFPNPDIYSACMASCEYYPDNQTMMMSGDSYQCRAYQLSRASQSTGNANMYCQSAGFNGGAYGSAGNMCGTFCEAYCDAMMGGCTAAGATVFANRGDCMRECSWFPKNSSFDLSSSAIAHYNSIDCRSWHAQVAINKSTDATQNMAHCGHASPQGGTVCGTACENYCDNDLGVCQGSLKQWTDRTQCLWACSTWPTTTNAAFQPPTTGGNSLSCRKYHASVAGISPSSADYHCIHTGPLGGYGVCGMECEGLCNLAVAACPSQVPAANCLTMCANLNSSSMVNTTSILSGSVPQGSVGCATYFAIKAGSNSALCTKLSNAFAAAFNAGKVCDPSAAFLLKVSWTVIAVIFLALGFTS